jgi:hypothetical protein
VIRQLEDVLHDFLGNFCTSIAPHVYLHESKDKANQFLERLFNQNEQALGLFYLHPDADAGVAVPSVALLRVGITLKVNHYKSLTFSRCGRLGPEFTAKLGWLIGNLYSRVGTPDWSESRERNKELKTLIKDTIDPEASESAPIWVRESWVKAAKDKGIQIANISPKNLTEELEKHKPPSAKKRVITRVTEILMKINPEFSIEQQKKLFAHLDNDPILSNILKKATTE